MSTPTSQPPGLARPGGALSRAALLTAMVLGAAGGLGLYTLHYAGGLSYFSADPRACANCHIMQPQLESWQKSSHHTAAACVDCHLPTAFVPKYLAKASNGWFHSKGFTLQDFPEPIRIKPSNSQILQDNCLRCHGELVHALGADTACTHCHITVGHGTPAGLGGRLRDHERTAP